MTSSAGQGCYVMVVIIVAVAASEKIDDSMAKQTVARDLLRPFAPCNVREEDP